MWFPVRFIPAGAGNTICAGFLFEGLAVYPRWRGEHKIKALSSNPSNGLSPLARGTLAAMGNSTRCFRFIPAGAGNTGQRPEIYQSSPVYPRWRGEHRMADGSRPLFFGLSPLARGTRGLSQWPGHERRFIPAGAGNTLNLRHCSKKIFLMQIILPTTLLQILIVKEPLSL